ncbi:MAG: DegV family protein [Christensenellales bacterium]|jgi:DegV family protein with EDD domain
MSSFILMCDSNSELPLWIQEKYQVPFIRMPYVLNGVEYAYDLGKGTDIPAFFEAEKAGVMPITNALPPEHYMDFWRPYLEAGQDILFIMFSSGLSAAYDYATMARQQILAEYPDRQIRLVDTLAISTGVALLICHALEMKEAGASMEEIESWVLNNRLRANMVFAVDDLNFLRRGGRISATTATVGTLLDVKPVLEFNRQGKLVSVGKVKGRKKVCRYLAEKYLEYCDNPQDGVLIIMHTNEPEAADQIEAYVREKAQPKEVWKRLVGPVIGTHAGPGTLGVVFMGKERTLP